ncbi:MAG TPA: hypothetical protein VF832_01565 [Longimicrobiales bacterium]
MRRPLVVLALAAALAAPLSPATSPGGMPAWLRTLLGPAPLAAQSLLATSGLGVPTPPLDARARALGGVPTGLFGLDLSLGNPADAADVRYRGGMASVQPFSRSDELGGQSASTSGARFPLLRVLYPTRRIVFSLGYGGFLDQSWGVSSTGVSHFGGDTATVTDITRSVGGISQLRLGASYLLSPRVALGGAVGLYTGNVTRDVTRDFPDSTHSDFLGFESRTQWGFHGPLASVGIRADIGAVLRVAGDVTWSGKLSADSSSGAARGRSYSLPLQAEAGASALLAPSLALSVGGTWANWSKTTFSGCGSLAICTPGSAAAFVARDTRTYGVGLEYGGTHAGVRTYPFRIGYHYAQLPFFAPGDDVLPTEKSGSVGMGVRIGGSENSPAAQLDGAIERGSRSGGATPAALSEKFWRLTFSLAVFGR